jgi:hypothetical protein
MRTPLIAVLLAGLVGCSGSDEMTGNGNDPAAALQCTTPTDPHPTLGTVFNVHAGHPATISTEGLTLGLQEVVEDSRCPQPMMCLVAGNVVIRISAQHPPDAPGEFVLGADDAPSNTATYAGYDIHMVQVLPYPEYGRQPTPSADYCVQLTVVPH